MKLIIQRWGYSDMLVEIIKEQIEMCSLTAMQTFSYYHQHISQ